MNKPTKTIKAWRIVEIKNNRPYTLFHALPLEKRSRQIPIDTWLKAEKKMVKDGTSKSKYLSGFNVLKNLDRMKEYGLRFIKPRDLRIIEILVNAGLRSKEHSKSDIWLADWMMIPSGWSSTAIKVKLGSKK